MRVKFIYHYDMDDSDFGGDYSAIEIILDGKSIKTYGDDYHDEGESKAIGFIDGLKYAFNEEISISYSQVADWEY